MSAPRSGLVLVNLGSPAAPTAPAVRRYLGQFLADPRVVELPRALWLPVLHGVILRTRPRRSAARYARIWTADGAPLVRHTHALAMGVAAALSGRNLLVDYAMTYGAPSIAARVTALLAEGVTRLAVVPLFPQYSATSTGAVYDALARALAGTRCVPELHVVRDFHLSPGYVAAVASQVLAHWARVGRGEHLVLSFHGLPQRSVDRGDPYAEQCAATAQALADALGLKSGEWTLAYQSRFGFARWLGPSTQDVITRLARAGARQVDVACPGFVTDCLETLEEIGIELTDVARAGGCTLRTVPCLNADPQFAATLAGIGLKVLGESPPDAM